MLKLNFPNRHTKHKVSVCGSSLLLIALPWNQILSRETQEMPSGDKINFYKKIFLINRFMKAIKTLERVPLNFMPQTRNAVAKRTSLITAFDSILSGCLLMLIKYRKIFSKILGLTFLD